ncbi:hypothetical protein ACQJBY_028288 [Aegilops geniculata]
MRRPPFTCLFIAAVAGEARVGVAARLDSQSQLLFPEHKAATTGSSILSSRSSLLLLSGTRHRGSGGTGKVPCLVTGYRTSLQILRWRKQMGAEEASAPCCLSARSSLLPGTRCFSSSCVLLLWVELPELDGKIIGLYFAANWYPKCEAFTPALAAAYGQLRERGAGFEVVFVSCDEDRPSFERFHRAMPWPAVPFGDLPCKKRLSDMFQVEGIPRLVVLAPGGAEVVCPDAVELVHRYGDPAFPFTPARVAELEADERSKFASQTLEKLFSVGHVKNGGDEQLLASPWLRARCRFPSRAWSGRRWGSTSRRTGASRASSSPRGWPPSTATSRASRRSSRWCTSPWTRRRTGTSGRGAACRGWRCRTTAATARSRGRWPGTSTCGRSRRWW